MQRFAGKKKQTSYLLGAPSQQFLVPTGASPLPFSTRTHPTPNRLPRKWGRICAGFRFLSPLVKAGSICLVQTCQSVPRVPRQGCEGGGVREGRRRRRWVWIRTRSAGIRDSFPPVGSDPLPVRRWSRQNAARGRDSPEPRGERRAWSPGPWRSRGPGSREATRDTRVGEQPHSCAERNEDPRGQPRASCSSRNPTQLSKHKDPENSESETASRSPEVWERPPRLPASGRHGRSQG